MTTPPGPHAMTAQAGAVAVVPVEPTPEMLAEGRQVSQFETRKVGCIYRAMLAAAPAPSAAVPVEALEGLVADMRDAADETSDHYEAKSLRLFARRLTQLIKERSNG